MSNTCFTVNSYILNDIEKLIEELCVMKKQEEKMQEELDDLKESLKVDKQNLDAVTSDRNRLLSLCNEKDTGNDQWVFYLCIIDQLVLLIVQSNRLLF